MADPQTNAFIQQLIRFKSPNPIPVPQSRDQIEPNEDDDTVEPVGPGRGMTASEAMGISQPTNMKPDVNTNVDRSYALQKMGQYGMDVHQSPNPYNNGAESNWSPKDFAPGTGYDDRVLGTAPENVDQINRDMVDPGTLPPDESHPINDQNKQVQMRNRMQNARSMQGSPEGDALASAMARVISGKASPEEANKLYSMFDQRT